MRIRPVSDLHFEFHADGGATLTKMLTVSKEFDVLVLAGDVSDARRLYASVALIADQVDKPIVYVLGNHEAYGTLLKTAESEARRLQEDFPHVHVLEQETVVIEGQRFVGCTLWYPRPNWTPQEEGFGDFHWIEDIRDWLHDRAMKSAKFLRSTVQEGDVVITHYLPHSRSILDKYRESDCNHFFLHNVGDVVQGGDAKLWIHGHTHGSRDYVVGKTRVVCNPLGYIRGMPGEPNREFDPTLTVEV